MEVNANPVIKALFTAIANNGSSKDSDMIDEMLRQVQKQSAYEKNQPGVKKPLFGHADLHRVLKDMVKTEANSGEEGAKGLPFSIQMAKVLLKQFEATLKCRAVFILIELMEHECTKKLVLKQVKAQKPDRKSVV